MIASDTSTHVTPDTITHVTFVFSPSPCWCALLLLKSLLVCFTFIKVLVGMLYFYQGPCRCALLLGKSPCKYALSLVKVLLGGLGFLKRCAIGYDHLRGHVLKDPLYKAPLVSVVREPIQK